MVVGWRPMSPLMIHHFDDITNPPITNPFHGPDMGYIPRPGNGSEGLAAGYCAHWAAFQYDLTGLALDLRIFVPNVAI